MKKSMRTEQEHTVNTITEEATLAHGEENRNWEIWLADTGASCHVTSHDENMTNGQVGEHDTIVVGDQRRCKVQKRGSLNLVNRTNKECIALENVRVVKEIAKNIISISKLLEDGGTIQGRDNTIELQINGVTVHFEKDEEDGLYYAQLRRMSTKKRNFCNRIETEDDEWDLVTTNEKKKWPKITREDAHSKWDHAHNDQLNTMGNFF